MFRFRTVLPACCLAAVALTAWAVQRHPAGRRPLTAEVVMQGGLDDFQATVEGDAVHVHARMNLMDRRGDHTYVWRLQVRRMPEDEVVINVAYPHQGWRVHPAHPREVTFEDTFRPGPGTHRVFLSVYGVPDLAPVDFEALDRPDHLVDWQVARDLATVTVP